MGQPAAKKGDQITAQDVHLVMVPAPPGSPVPVTQMLPFNGVIDGNLSTDVNIMGKPAATVGSTATNTPSHVWLPPGLSFQIPPMNKGTIMAGSGTVTINSKPVARAGDQAQTCQDPAPNMDAKVVASGTVLVGG